MASPNEIIAASFEELEKALDQVVVESTKAIKDSRRDSRVSHGAAGSASALRIEYATEDFHTALDDIEREITRAMAVKQRDVAELRKKKETPPAAAPATAAEPKPVAPPAPMATDLGSPNPSIAHPPGPAPSSSGPRAPGPAHSSRQESKPPAPVPDMGFDLTVSPEVRPSPSPALPQSKATQVKPSPKTAAVAARPGSAPPKKEPKLVAQQPTSRTAGSTPQPSTHAPPAPVAPPAPMMDSPMSLASSMPPGTVAPAAAQTQGQPVPQEMVFTNMAFSVAPAVNEPTHGGSQTQPPTQQQHAADNNDMVNMVHFGAPADMPGDFNMSSFDPGFDLTSGGMDNSNNSDSLLLNGPSDVDADIERLFASQEPNSAEKMDMDYALDEIGLSNSNFEDINWGDDIDHNFNTGP